MDLRLKEVAELLNVSETTVRRWVADSRIPHYRLNNHLRFNRSEIENWVFSRQSPKEEDALFSSTPMAANTEKLGTQQFSLLRAIHRGGVWPHIAGSTKEEVIRNAMSAMAPVLHLDAEVLGDLLLDRERLMSTALPRGIAVPHTRDFLLSEAFDLVAVAFLDQPIDYGALDGTPVHTLFFLFACDDRRHLHLLAKVAHFCSQWDHIHLLEKKPSKEELLSHIKQWEKELSTPVTVMV